MSPKKLIETLGENLLYAAVYAGTLLQYPPPSLGGDDDVCLGDDDQWPFVVASTVAERAVQDWRTSRSRANQPPTAPDEDPDLTST